MLKLPPWFQTISRAGGPQLARLLAAAILGLFMLPDSFAQAPLPVVQLTSSAYSVSENNGAIRIAVRRFGPTNLVSTVRLSAVGAPTSGAVDGQDFIAKTATPTFPVKATEAFFDLVILDNDQTNASKFI